MTEKLSSKGREHMLKGLSIRPEKCVRCYLCQLECSFLKEGSFNPEEAFIKVNWRWPSDEIDITFTNDCDGCGVCVKACIYQCLSLKEG